MTHSDIFEKREENLLSSPGGSGMLRACALGRNKKNGMGEQEDRGEKNRWRRKGGIRRHGGGWRRGRRHGGRVRKEKEEVKNREEKLRNGGWERMRDGGRVRHGGGWRGWEGEQMKEWR